MTGQPFDGPTPGSDVSRGRRHMTMQTRVALLSAVGLFVILGVGYSIVASHRQADPTQKFAHDMGRPYALPPLPVPPEPPTQPEPVQSALQAPVSPSTPIMGFWQDASLTHRAGEGVQRSDASAADGTATAAEVSPQDAGADAAQHHAGIGHATVGKPYDLHYLLKRNTIFHCIPEQPLDSDVPGPIGCIVAEDVKSADGTVVLIEKGSSVDGEVTHAPNAGTNRMFIEFDEILTLTGIPIYLSSSGGDTLGTSGIDGAVNEHLWRKIRSAVLLSAIEIAGNVASNESQRASSVNFSVGTGQGESLASQALAHDINIAPTLYRNQADPITVTVRQDIPMDSAYRLVAVGGSP